MKRPKIFYGYWIVVIGLFCLFTSSGTGWYAFAVLNKPIGDEFGWSRSMVMWAFTLFFVVRGLAGPFIGRLTDSYGSRKVIFISAVIAGFGFVLLSFMQSLWHFYILYVLVGIGTTGIGVIPLSAVISNWFIKKRGKAIGIATAGIGIGGLVLSPLLSELIIPYLGWREAYLFLAIIIWTLIPVVLLGIKASPEEIGLYPDGAVAPETVKKANASSQSSKDWTLKAALPTSSFWLIVVGFLLTNLSSTGVAQNQVDFLSGVGFPMAAVGTALAGVGIGSTIGKFGFGWLSDQLHAKYCAAISFALEAIAIVILLKAKSMAMVWLYAIFMGLGIGGWAPLTAMLVGIIFGSASYGTIYGVVMSAVSIGVGTGPLIAGYMYDAMETYFWVFVLFLAFYAIAIPAILTVRRPKSPGISQSDFNQ